MTHVPQEPVQPPLPGIGRGLMLASLGAAVVALLLFAQLAEGVFEGGTTRFDASLRTHLHALASPGLTRVMTGVSLLGFEFLYLANPLAVVLFLAFRWKRAAVLLAVTMGGALVLDVTLKAAFHRPRPVPFFGTAPHSYSFPSGHSLVSFCFYGVLAGLLAARLRSTALRVACWTSAALLVAAIGVSRIYLGVHYPSDVVAGYLAAAMWVATIVAVDRWRKRRRAGKQAGKN